jgi:excinuclease ABC subunit A
LILSPVVRGRKGEYRKEIAEWQKKGFQRLKVNGTVYEIGDAPKLDKKYKHDIDVVVDRIVVKKDLATRLADSFEQALKLSDGIAVAEFVDKPLNAPSPRSSRGEGRGEGRQQNRRKLPPIPLPLAGRSQWWGQETRWG